MNWELIVLLTGLMLFAHWFNYIMGTPMADRPDGVHPREILFGIPYTLAVWRLKRKKLYYDVRRDQTRELKMAVDARTRNGVKIDHRLDLYLLGREFFTWEKSLLCPICFHWWLTVFVGVFFYWCDVFNARADFLLAAFTYLVNHFLIRKIS